MKSLIIRALLAMSGLVWTHAFAASEPAELVTLRAKFTSALDRATEAMKYFWPAYKRDLEELKPKAKAEGNLDGVLAIEAELKAADRMSLGRNAAYEPLKALQANYETLRRELNQQIFPEKKRLYDIYLTALDSLQVNLTKESRLDEAILVRNTAAAAKLEAGRSTGQPAPAANAAVANNNNPNNGGKAVANANAPGASDVVGHNGGGSEYRDVGADGGILVGFEMVITPFKESNDTVRGVAPIYLSSKGSETKGGTYGKQRGASSRRVVAKAGYAVGKVTAQFDSVAIRRMKIRFDRINGNQLDPKDSYESAWVGIYQGATEGNVDLQGKLPVGIAGRSGEGLNCLGLLFRNP